MNIPVLEANYAKLYTMTELRLCIEGGALHGRI